MARAPSIPAPGSVTADTPLRLDVAAVLAFPDGSMSASGLRREAERDRLVIERIAGKDYTTLGNIERMRHLCRVEARDRDCGCSLPDGMQADESSNKPSGSFETATLNAVLAQAKAKLQKLKAPCATTSTTRQRLESATVTPLPSRSPT